MAINFNTNISALVASYNLSQSQATVSHALQNLSSGLRINNAADDPAGLAIADGMTAQINGMNQAYSNINNAVNLLQTADGALSGITGNLQRIRDLSVQSANGSNSSSERAALDLEVQQLKVQIQQVADTTNYNGLSLLNGSVAQLSFLVGPNANDSIAVEGFQSMQLSTLGTSGAGSLVAGTATVAALNAGDLTLNGVSVAGSVTGPGAGEAASSALEIAAAINGVSGSSGVTASAATTLSGTAPAGNAVIQDFLINGVLVSTGAGGISNLIGAVNQAGVTGIAATLNAAGGMTLTASNGQDINIELSGTAVNSAAAASDRAAFLNATGIPNGAVGTEASAAVAAIPAVPAQYDIHGHLLVPGTPGQPYQPPVAASYATTTGIVTIRSADSAGIEVGGNAPGSAGFLSGLENQNSTSTIQGIAALNVLTQAAAQRAITSMDSAISMVTNSQDQIGAYESRLASAAANNQTGLENMMASRSTVEDANFAAELTKLSTAKILQQAGHAMLAQANSTSGFVKMLLH